MTVAQLGLAVDGKGARQATVDLDALTVAAGKAEKGTENLGRSSREMSATIQAMTAILQNIEQHTATMAAATSRATVAFNDNSKAVTRLAVEQREAGGAMGAVTSALTAEAAAARNATAALDKATAAAARNAATGGAHNLNTSNIAAQFQDIGVTAAAGMSPLQIALQQGTQLSAVLTDLKGNGVSTGAALAAAFSSIVSPVSLVTLGVVAASAAAIQYFSSVASQGKSADDVLKTHGTTIAALKTAYGTALDGLKAYSDQSARVAEAIVRGNADALVASLSKQVTDALNEMASIVATRGGVLFHVDEQFKPFEEAIKNLRQSALAGAPDLAAFRDAVAAVVNAASKDAELRKQGAALLEMSKNADETSRALKAANSAIAESGRVASGAIAAVQGYRDALSDLSKIAVPTLSPRQQADEAYGRALEGATSTGARAAADAEYLATRTRLAQEAAEKQSKIASDQAEQAAERSAREAKQQEEALARRVEQHQQAVMTEEEQERDSYERRMADLEAYYEAGKFSLEEYQEWTQKAQEKHSERMTAIAAEQAQLEMDIRDKTLTATSNLFGALSQLMEASGQKNFAVAKAFGIGQAVINTAQGITEALKLPFPANWIQAAAVGAAGAAQIATIASARPGGARTPTVSGGGGGGSGGSSAAPAAAAEPAQPSHTAFFQFSGKANDKWTTSEVVEMIKQINDLQKDGYKIVVAE